MTYDHDRATGGYTRAVLIPVGYELRLRPHEGRTAVIRASDGSVKFDRELLPDCDIAEAIDQVRAARVRSQW